MSHLNAEQIIIDRLGAELTTKGLHVLSASDLHHGKQSAQLNPAVQVIFHDEIPEKSKGRVQKVRQQWLIVVVVRNVKDKSGEAAREEAGQLINDVIKALHNYEIGRPCQRFERIKSPYRADYVNGLFYFPLAFETEIITHGAKQ